MAKLVASLLLVLAAIAVMLGNMWFTYGLWPQSWGAFVGFCLGAIAIQVASMAIVADDE